METNLLHVGGFNLSLVMRELLGKGTPRGWQGLLGGCSFDVFAALDRASGALPAGNGRYFRGQHKSRQLVGTLPDRLTELQTHVLLWLSKYEIWIPDKPEHPLVYMADEQRHGVGFPAGIDELVDQILAQV